MKTALGHTRHIFLVLFLLPLITLFFPACPVQAHEDAETQAWNGLQRRVLQTYAAATWHSFEQLTQRYATGLPADYCTTTDPIDCSGYTSPTNIGVYIWSTLAARELHLINPIEAYQRLAQTLKSLNQLERYQGQFYNWYDPATLTKLTTECPFLSTVDNGWLASALIMITNSMPLLRHQAKALLETMNFNLYYDPQVGLLYGGYWPPNSAGCPSEGPSGWHYDILNTEPRIASYIGIARNHLPPEHYFKLWRTFPNTCDWGWQEMKPEGTVQTYLGVNVFEGTYQYKGMKLVPSWGGSLFEALMVTLLVPEEDWGTKSWGVTHPLYVKAHIKHGLEEAQYGVWGFSPTTNPSDPQGGYGIYGVDAIGMWDAGYASNNDNTLVDYGFGTCQGREPKPVPPPSAYTNGVAVPHASFLALHLAPDEALDNLDTLRRRFPDIFDSQWGFRSSVNVQTGEVAHTVLALDQGMIMAAIGNALTHNRLQAYFSQGQIERAIRPLMAIETFSAGESVP